MQMNKKMQERLEELHDFIHSLRVDEQLRHLIDSPILEIDGCFFLGDLWKGTPHASFSSFPDRTGFECFINHIHLEDYLDSSGSPNLLSDLLLAHGFQYALQLKEKLATYRPELCFRVILAAASETCTVRFHQLRELESWLADDLEGYREEAVSLMDTDKMMN